MIQAIVLMGVNAQCARYPNMQSLLAFAAGMKVLIAATVNRMVMIINMPYTILFILLLPSCYKRYAFPLDPCPVASVFLSVISFP